GVWGPRPCSWLVGWRARRSFVVRKGRRGLPRTSSAGRAVCGVLPALLLLPGRPRLAPGLCAR
ncbi:unnamed protein product, partial [Amoebophrya sp. A120]